MSYASWHNIVSKKLPKGKNDLKQKCILFLTPYSGINSLLHTVEVGIFTQKNVDSLSTWLGGKRETGFR